VSAIGGLCRRSVDNDHAGDHAHETILSTTQHSRWWVSCGTARNPRSSGREHPSVSAFFRAFLIAPGAIYIEGGAIAFERANRCHQVLSDGTITPFADGGNFSGSSPWSVAEN
jgi:hypothetical protein